MCRVSENSRSLFPRVLKSLSTLAPCSLKDRRESCKPLIPAGVEVKVEGNVLRVERQTDDRKLRALHGLTRKLIANMAQGVSQGFTRVLDINGVGYRAEVKGQEIHMTLGYSHPVVFPLPTGVTAAVERQVSSR